MDYVIPEEYFADEEIIQYDYTIIDRSPVINTEYVWISHTSGIQGGISYFSSLNSAVNSLRRLGITVYDSQITHGPQKQAIGTASGMRYSAKIKSKDIDIVYNSKWFISRKLNKVID